MGMPEDSAQVQTAVEQSYKDMIEMAKEDEDDSDEDLTDAELAEAFLEGIQEMVNDPELLQMVELQCGEGAAEYIIRAVQVFCDSKKLIQDSQKGDESLCKYQQESWDMTMV